MLLLQCIILETGHIAQQIAINELAFGILTTSTKGLNWTELENASLQSMDPASRPAHCAIVSGKHKISFGEEKSISPKSSWFHYSET